MIELLILCLFGNLFNKLKKNINHVHSSVYSPACGDPPTFSDASVKTVSGIMLNDKVIYTCSRGHALFGKPSSVCQANGKWSQRKFQCRSK